MSAGDQPVRVPNSRVTKRVDLALTTPARSIELRYRLSRITVRSTSQAGRAPTISPLVEGNPRLSSCDAGARWHRAQHRCPMIRSLREQALDRPLAQSSRLGNCQSVMR